MIFNDVQKAVIDCKNNILVFASAGTGKTSTLSEKIRLQILNDRINPENILCLTFTNRGCEEIRKKVSENVNTEVFKKLTIKTFHAFCNEIITEYYIFKGNPLSNVSIYDESDCCLICKSIIDETNIELNFKDNNDGLSKLISYMKEILNNSFEFEGNYLETIKSIIRNQFIDFSQKLDEHFEPQMYKGSKLTKVVNSETLCHIVESYQHYLEMSHAFDFNDLVYYANRYLFDEDFRDFIAKKYSWIYIDEAQDTSFIEYSLIKKITNYSKVFLSGDFFQTIYEWRGSTPEQILQDFKTSFKPDVFCYDVNYRSTKTLASASFSVLRKLFPEEVAEIYKEGISVGNYKNGEPIYSHESFNTTEEARFINEDIIRHQTSDACILVRTNTYAKDLSKCLEEINPNRYFLVQDYQYYKRPEVKEILAFLRLILNPYDAVSLERIAVRYVRGFGDKKLSELISNEAYETGVRINDLLDKKTHENGGDKYRFLEDNLMLGNVVVFDTETTGLDVESDEVVQIACKRIDQDGNELNRFTTLVKTRKGVGESEKVHHISDEQIAKEGMAKTEALKKFLEFTKDSVLVGHNVTFDISIMNSELERNGFPIINNDFYDTLELARRFVRGSKNYKLEVLTEYLSLPSVGYHDAMEDVTATSNLLLYLVNKPIRKTRETRVKILTKYLHLFKNLMEVLDFYKQRLYGSNFDKYVEDVISSLNMEKIYKDKTQQLFNIHHFIRLSRLRFNDSQSNFNSLKTLVNVSSLSTNDFDAIYKELGLIPIITVHQSKGCEFDTVYMAGVEDNMYPAYYSYGKSENEEKRVFYVGITRAKKRLVITYRQFEKHGHPVYPSHYLLLFDQELISKF